MANERYLQAMKRYDLVKEGPRQEEILQAKAAMEQAQAQYRLVKEGPRKEDIDQARAKVEQAKAALQAAETKLGYATVTLPLTGVVLSKNIEPGEYVAAGTPVVTVADIENLWLRAYVDERDLGNATSPWAPRPRSPPTPIRTRSTRAEFPSSRRSRSSRPNRCRPLANG